MKMPSRIQNTRLPFQPRTCGAMAVALAAFGLAGPAAAQVSPASEIEQPAPFDSTGEFGGPRTLSADIDTVLVGDPGADTVASNAGEAYIYQRDVGVPAQFNLAATLNIPTGAADDNFGGTTAIQNNTAVVGARGDDTLALDSGAAYVFGRNVGGANAWGQIAKLLPSDGQAEDFFSSGAIAIDGDTVFVAATNVDSEDKGPNSGAVYVFQRNQGGANAWGQVAKIVPPNFFGSGFFGRALAVDGDRLAVGSFRDRVFIYERNAIDPTQWVLAQTVTASDDTGNSEQFGNGGLNLEGDRLVVAARTDNNDNGNIAGSVYIFEDQNGSFVETQRLQAVDGGESFTFGRDTALAGDLLLVGHHFRRTPDGRRTGLVNVYEPNPKTGLFEETTRLRNSAGEAFTNFGFAVAIAGDTPLVGASADSNTTGRDAGTVFTYDLSNIADFGDAPAPYPTLLANDGARHNNVSPDFALGATVDAEEDGAPQLAARGDDSGNDDEDGVVINGAVRQGENASVTVSFTGPNAVGDTGLVSAWVDFNRDGDWNDAGEWVLQNVAVTNGDNVLQFAVPVEATAGPSFARFRLTSAGVNLPTGAAADGEVEDLPIDIGGTPTLSIRRLVAITEGNGGNRGINVPVTLSSAATEPVTGSFTLLDNSARSSDGDYTAATGQFTIPAGRMGVAIRVTVNGDLLDERNEAFRVVIDPDSLNGALAGNLTAVVRVRDDDAPPSVSFTAASTQLNEGVGRTAVVRLSAPSGRRLVIPLVVSGSATSGADYNAIRNTVEFNVGETEKTIRIQSVDDDLTEGAETVILTLGTAANVTPGAITQFTATIRASD